MKKQWHNVPLHWIQEVPAQLRAANFLRKDWCYSKHQVCFSFPSHLAHVRILKQSVTCGVKYLVLMNPGNSMLIRLTDLHGVTLLVLKAV